MDWARILAYVTGMVDQELLARKLSPIRSSAGYTIDMHESDFSEATGRTERFNFALPVGSIGHERLALQTKRSHHPHAGGRFDFGVNQIPLSSQRP